MNTETKNRITELLLDDSMNELNNTINTTLDNFKTSLEARIDGMKTEAYANIHKLESYITAEKPLVVNLGTVEVPKEKLVHKAFSTIIKILSSTKRKEKNIMLVGGAGGGKTHLVGSIAEALKLPFYPMSVGLQTTKSDLLGFINANGIYMPSPIRLAYEHGGVLLLDEFDAAHAGVITILNSLLANGHCSFPDNIVEKHKDFVCLCACNTYGKGGTMDYVGRNRLDAATLDRFIIVDVNYDENLERTLTKNEQWTNIINKIRDCIAKYGIKMIVSPRASMDGADLLDAGFSVEDTLEMCVFKGCGDDIKDKIMQNINLQSLEQSSGIVEPFNLDILVNFDNFKYNVIFNNASFPDDEDIHIDISSNMRLNLSMPESGDYTPKLETYGLYLAATMKTLEQDSCYNQPSQIKKLLKEMSDCYKYTDTRDTVRLSVIYKGEKSSVNLNTGEYTSETTKRRRKVK